MNVGKKMVKEKYKKETKKADLRILIRSDKTYFPYPTLGLYRNCQKMRKYKHCVEVYAQSRVIKNLLMSLKITKNSIFASSRETESRERKKVATGSE